MATEEQQPTRPDWMSEDFLKTVIKNDLKASSSEFIEVGDVKIQYVVPKGENYTSIILRVTVSGNFGQNCTKKLQNGHANHQNGTQNGTGNENGDQEKRKYVLKVLHESGDMKTLTDEVKVFDREVDMLLNVLPNFQMILEKVDLPITFCAKIFHRLPELGVIVMDDLAEKGYVLGNRLKGADLDECKVLFLKLARLHGSSMKYYEDKSLDVMNSYYFESIFAELKDEKAQELRDTFFGREILEKKVQGMANDILQRPGYEREHQLLLNIKDIAYDLIFDSYSYKPGNIFNAHLHGDCWLNNMLFKYDKNGRAIDVILVDLQIAYYNSVVNDFHYFFISSASDKVRKYHYKELAKFYFENLIETLHRVGYNGTKPSFEQFQKELLKGSSIFLMHLSIFLPILKAQFSTEQKDRSKPQDVSVEGMVNIVNENRTNPIYQESLFVSMDMLRNEGIIEYHEKLIKEYPRKKE